jgi:hypothetical protein
MDILKIEPGSSSETCPTSPFYGDQMIDVKVEEDHMPVTFEGIKAEPEVSCMCVCPVLVFLISTCRSVHIKHLYSEWILKSSLEIAFAGLYFLANCLWSTNSISVRYLYNNYMVLCLTKRAVFIDAALRT